MVLIDLTGQTFGRLFVLQRHFPNGPQGQPMWECRCECGNVVVTWGQSLRRKESRSCGCLHAESIAKSNSLPPYRSTYNVLCSSAKRAHKVMKLTFKQFMSFVGKPCFYCGTKLAWPEHNAKNGYKGYHLDRKNTLLGYTVNNCVACCWRCNRAKSNTFSFEEWIEVGKAIKRFRKVHGIR